MTLYLVTIITDHHLTCLQMRAKDKPTAAEKGVDVFIASEKPPGGGWLAPRRVKYGFKSGIKHDNCLFRVVISC